VKFLIDNQLPSALAQYLKKRGFDCEHVLNVNLGAGSDADICEYAMRQERVIISKDQDFLYLANQPQTNIKLVWVRLGNCRTQVLLEAFDRLWPTIESCLKAGDRIVEVR